MSKAENDVTSGDAPHKVVTTTTVRDLADELHDRLAEVQALADACGAVAACTSITRGALDRLRHTIVNLSAAATDAGEIMLALRAAVRS